MTITAEEAQAAGLSQEEIDAINEVDGQQDDDTLAEIAGDYDGAATDEDGGGDDAITTTDNDGGGDDAITTTDDDGGGDDAITTTDEADPLAGIADVEINFTPKLTGELMPEYVVAADNAYAAAAEKLDAIEAKYAGGDLDAKERREEISKIERERDSEIRKINAASTNAEIEAQRWQADQQAFFKTHGAYTSPLLFNALNAEVVRIANLPGSVGKSGMAVLMAAKGSIDRQLAGLTGQQVKADTAPAAGKPKAARPGVQTLGGVPTAQSADTGGDKWARIDKLSGLEYEKALASMSESEQAAYLASR